MTLADPLATALVVAFVLALIVAGALGWACYRLLVDRGHLLLRLPDTSDQDAPQSPGGLRPGSFLSDFALPALGGGTVTLSGLVGRPLLLVFVRPDCLFSRALARELAGDALLPDALLPVLTVSGAVNDPKDLAPFTGLPGPVLLDPDGQVASLTRVTATPAGYSVDEGRRTVGPLLTGPAALLAAARGEPLAEFTEPPLAVTPMPSPPSFTLTPLQPGDVAPDFTLPTVTGDAWSLRDQRGSALALVFSDPDCPPCAPLMAGLKWVDQSGIVLIGRGDAAANRQIAETAGLSMPVLLQQNREVARSYRTLETPAAYLIDARGAIAAGPAIGADEVLALLARRGENPFRGISTARVALVPSGADVG
jgi:peroxiredoxin